MFVAQRAAEESAPRGRTLHNQRSARAHTCKRRVWSVNRGRGVYPREYKQSVVLATDARGSSGNADSTDAARLNSCVYFTKRLYTVGVVACRGIVGTTAMRTEAAAVPLCI